MNSYNGPTLNGVPHGFGTLQYADGKTYTGSFVNGKRHGRGRLTMPNGEFFEGAFYNDSLTEDGIYYDEMGNPRLDAQVAPKKSFGKLLWEKTWRLWAALACFALAALFVWLITEFFTSSRSGRVRVGLFVAPLFLGWYGIKSLFGFFVNLFPKQTR